MATTVKKHVPTATTAKAKPSSQHKSQPEMDFAFGKENYTLMLVGIGVIVLGYILMAGGSPDDPTAFSMDIFNFQRITLAPIVVTIGFIIEVFAIVRKAKD